LETKKDRAIFMTSFC